MNGMYGSIVASISSIRWILPKPWHYILFFFFRPMLAAVVVALFLLSFCVTSSFSPSLILTLSLSFFIVLMWWMWKSRFLHNTFKPISVPYFENHDIFQYNSRILYIYFPLFQHYHISIDSPFFRMFVLLLLVLVQCHTHQPK